MLFSACKGYTGLLAFANTKVYRESQAIAPALVIAGPYDDLREDQLFLGSKEFYRRLAEQSPEFDNSIVNASGESGHEFGRTIFPVLVYGGLLEYLITSLRKDQREERMNRIREQFLKGNNKRTLSPGEEKRLEEACSPAFQAKTNQQQWDTMFMIDIFPENQKRFGVNWLSVTEKILDIQK